MARKIDVAPTPVAPQLTFTDSDVKTMDLFAALVNENMRTVPSLTIPQVMQIAHTLAAMNALRNKINDHVMEVIPRGAV